MCSTVIYTNASPIRPPALGLHTARKENNLLVQATPGLGAGTSAEPQYNDNVRESSPNPCTVGLACMSAHTFSHLPGGGALSEDVADQYKQLIRVQDEKFREVQKDRTLVAVRSKAVCWISHLRLSNMPRMLCGFGVWVGRAWSEVYHAHALC